MKISPGCQHCYAETFSKRVGRNIWGPAATTERWRTKGPWRDVLKWDAAAKAEGIRRKVFCQSMSDFFEDHPQLVDWRNEAIEILEQLEWLDVQLLTKRPENIGGMVPVWWTKVQWPAHIWVGTSVENQAAADERIPYLLEIPAKVRFLSCEPLLGPIDFRKVPGFNRIGLNLSGWWCIVGGESGHNARPMHPDWARSLHQQCSSAGVAFHFKQWGEWHPVAALYGDDDFTFLLDEFSDNRIKLLGKDGYLFSESKGVNEEYWCGFQPYPSSNPWFMAKVGKHNAGRLLDGREWNEFPEVKR